MFYSNTINLMLLLVKILLNFISSKLHQMYFSKEGWLGMKSALVIIQKKLFFKNISLGLNVREMFAYGSLILFQGFIEIILLKYAWA